MTLFVNINIVEQLNVQNVSWVVTGNLYTEMYTDELQWSCELPFGLRAIIDA